ncbi:MAG: alpha-amylase family glycosyl hydrolase [Pseudomonadota bacterium]
MQYARDIIGADENWWRGAVIYQIYPRSFQDSNNDGIGDLAGIVHRLPHVAELGVDAIWISPFFRSPMKDFGYDVSEYRDVDPIFGAIGDFEALIHRAHQLGLRVLIDLVLSHTSDQHPWFRESRVSRDNPKADWYVWADAKPDGTSPNNWLSIFGGTAWEWSTERRQYYLHNFLAEQPDLNLHNPEVQDEMLDVARFWLDKGVDGFRLDTVNFYFHDDELRDNPVLPEAARNEVLTPSVNPYNWQDHVYDKNRPETEVFLQRLRSVFNEYEATTSVGEIGDAQRGPEIQAAYTAGGDKLHMCYDFSFLSNTPPSGLHFAEVLRTFAAAGPESWPLWAFSNHDVMRHVSRWALDEPAARVYAALLMSLRGSICLYQGEELGLPEAYVPFEDLQDPYGIRFWPRYHGRDGCRTPMPWTTDVAHGGFSTAPKTWLPITVDHLDRAVSLQDADRSSMLTHYREMLAYRRERPVLLHGSLDIVEARADFLSFVRRWDGQGMFCAFALGEAPQTITYPAGDWRADVMAPIRPEPSDPITRLDGWTAFFAQAVDI